MTGFSQSITAVTASFKAATRREEAATRRAEACIHFFSPAKQPTAGATDWVATKAECVLTSARSVRAFGRSPMPATAPLNPHRERVAAPAVRAKLFAAIGKRVAEADRDDMAQSAYVRLLMMPSLPATENELLSLAVTIVRGVVVDHHRKRKVREDKHAAGADVDDIAADTHEVSAAQREEWRQMLEFVEREVAAGRVSADVLRWAKRLAAGDSFAQIAADERVPVSTVKAKMLRARDHLRKRWPLYASAAGALIIVVWTHEPEPVSVGHGRAPPASATAPSMAPSGSAPAVPLTSSDYRDKAARECRARAFEACERDLDLARKNDATSESLPEVNAMRREIDRWRHAPDAKPE